MVLRAGREQPMLAVFIAIAVALRITFWFYTGRVWEDGLITMSAARNVWAGFGLTHHASEPYVQCFSSPLIALVDIAGEAFGAGLVAARLASLAAAAATIYFAYRIGVSLAFHWAGQVLALAYLSCDQLQIFFGMGGMETQLVTAVAVGVVYFYIARSWRALGLTCGLATISRPEFLLFLLPPVAVALLAYHRRALFQIIPSALAIAVPWYAWATWYYGSPVPQTIVAKSSSLRRGALSVPWEQVWNYAVSSWRDYAPFREFWVCFGEYGAPLPWAVLKVVVTAVALLFVAGFCFAAMRRNALCLAGVATLAFLLYRTCVVMNSYFMWYLPPFIALAFLVASYGLSVVARRLPHLAAIVGIGLAVAYALHLPFSMPLDRKVQRNIEMAVRGRAGELVTTMMRENDTLVLEPLGFVGWAAFKRTIYDYPGLGSKVALHAIRAGGVTNLAGLIDRLQPTHALVRPNEFDDLARQFPETAAKYEVAAHLKAKRSLRLYHMGYGYAAIDNDFRILRRTRDFEAVVRP